MHRTYMVLDNPNDVCGGYVGVLRENSGKWWAGGSKNEQSTYSESSGILQSQLLQFNTTCFQQACAGTLKRQGSVLR